MTRARGVLVTVVLALLGWQLVAGAAVADAHAVVQATSPANDSVVATPPRAVSITFSEKVQVTAASVRVFDGVGERVDVGNVRVTGDGRTATVGVRTDVARGSFVVAWKVVSADSHPVHGGFVYSVGAPSHVAGLDRLVATGDNPTWVVAGQALRFLALLGMFFAVGGAVYVAFITDDARRVARCRLAVAAAALVTVVASVAQVPQLAALATGLGAGSLSNPGVARQVLGAGVAWTLVLAIVAVAAAALLVWFENRRALRVGAPIAAVVAAASFAASGHSRTTSPEVLSALIVAAHGMAALLWVGLVLHLTWHLRRDEPTATPVAVLRLSRVATVALGVIAISGAVMGLQHVGSWHGLTSTTYGRLVGLKVLLVALVAGAAAFNHFRLVPRLRGGNPNRTVWRYLRRTLQWEAVGLVAVVAVTAVLVSVVPARTVIDASRIVTVSAPLGSGTVNVVVDPASTGAVTMHLYLLDEQGRVDDRAQEVSMRSILPMADGEELARQDMRRVGPGHYQVDGTLFPIAGKWKVSFEVRVGEFDELQTDVTIPVGSNR